MKTTQFKLMLTLATVASTSASAQLQLGPHASFLKGTGDNAVGTWGGGLHAKFFLGKHLALGAGVRALPEKRESTSVGNTAFKTTDALAQYYGSIDFLLGAKRNAVQPYIGADAGVSSNKRVITSTTGTSTSTTVNNKQSFFYLAPKAGLNIALGQAFGLFGQASYGLTFGNGEPGSVTIPGFESKPVDKFFVFDMGIYLRISGAK
jgi:hypothetical protein